MKKLLLILLCLPFIGFGQTQENKSSFNFNATNDYSRKSNKSKIQHYILKGKVKSVIETCYSYRSFGSAFRSRSSMSRWHFC